MKICAIICEYNPFHNGHKYLIEQAKRLSGCDAALCVMSASFTQRGEAAVLDKFTRATHAVLGGADCVIQLPAMFSVAPAEIFARGAVSILAKIPAVTHLAFGSEIADKAAIRKAADAMDDGEAFGKTLKLGLSAGESYKKSLAAALCGRGADSTVVNSPNGILAIEYARALKLAGSGIEILPIERVGGRYDESELRENFSSASAIRANLSDERTADNVPDYVLRALAAADLKSAAGVADALTRCALERAKKEDLKRIFGCSEGLENKLKSSVGLPLEDIISRATGKRYTSSRIRRILTANLLDICSDEVKRAITAGTYIKPLAVKRDVKDSIFAELARSPLPVLIKKTSVNMLTSPEAKECYRRDLRADFVRSLIYAESPVYDFTVKLV